MSDLKYSKVRFLSKYNGHTASIILTDCQQERMTITEISKLFPMHEAMKMERLERGEFYNTYEEAFNNSIEVERNGLQYCKCGCNGNYTDHTMRLGERGIL